MPRTEPEEKHASLAEKIREILLNGLNLSDEVLHYIDSTFSHPSAEALEAIIDDESDSERDSLLDLIFFPDHAVQMQLEDILAREAFQKTDEEKILKALFCGHPPETVLHFPEGRGVLRLSMPEWVAEGFISRLNISRNLDKRVIETIHHHAPDTHQTAFKVRLRNMRSHLTENKIGFLCDFFEKMDFESHDPFNYLGVVLGFLDEIQNGDIWQSLMDKKRVCLQSVQKAVKFEEQLRKSNVETLILQGVRTPHMDKTDALNRIVMIDTISLAVFAGRCF